MTEESVELLLVNYKSYTLPRDNCSDYSDIYYIIILQEFQTLCKDTWVKGQDMHVNVSLQ